MRRHGLGRETREEGLIALHSRCWAGHTRRGEGTEEGKVGGKEASIIALLFFPRVFHFFFRGKRVSMIWRGSRLALRAYERFFMKWAICSVMIAQHAKSIRVENLAAISLGNKPSYTGLRIFKYSGTSIYVHFCIRTFALRTVHF
jgi:hypothetical protein